MKTSSSISVAHVPFPLILYDYKCCIEASLIRITFENLHKTCICKMFLYGSPFRVVTRKIHLLVPKVGIYMNSLLSVCQDRSEINFNEDLYYIHATIKCTIALHLL